MIQHLFFDVGGVLLTNGWDRHGRRAAAEKFGYPADHIEQLHYERAEAFEKGALGLEQYLDEVVFSTDQPFSREEYLTFVYGLSQPYTDNFTLLRRLKKTGRYTLASLNNESAELNEFRIRHFGLDGLLDQFFSSCYLGTVKPEPAIFRRVLGITRYEPDHCLFVDDRENNVAAAQEAGMRAVHLPEPQMLAEVLREAGVMLP